MPEGNASSSTCNNRRRVVKGYEVVLNLDEELFTRVYEIGVPLQKCRYQSIRRIRLLGMRFDETDEEIEEELVWSGGNSVFCYYNIDQVLKSEHISSLEQPTTVIPSNLTPSTELIELQTALKNRLNDLRRQYPILIDSSSKDDEFDDSDDDGGNAIYLSEDITKDI